MSSDPWSLEVVRGKSVGRIYPIGPGPVTLGNALGGASGLDLSGEEGDGSRKMAGRQALIEPVADGFGVRDLDSPGGTFVNRQRVLPGLARPLVAGDVLQLGGVQLKVVGGNGVAKPAPPTPSPSPQGWTFHLPGGVVCRSFDEILTVSAQRWSALRDEVTSGRADAFVRSIGRPDLAPPPSGTADDRLDAWLGLLPTAKAKEPVLEVHPETLVVKVGAGGGRTRRTVAASNVGYRLLKIDARVEPGADWLRPAASGTITVVESANIPFEIDLPESLDKPMTAALTLDSNGGTKRVTVRLEASKTVEAAPVPATRPAEAPLLASVSPRTRLILFTASFASLRSVAGLAARFVSGGTFVPAAVEEPALFGPAVVFAVVGAVVGVASALKRKEDPGGIAAWFVSFGVFGLFLAAGFVAACRSLEPLLGLVGRHPVGQAVVWAMLGAVAARASMFVAPYTPNATEKRT